MSASPSVYFRPDIEGLRALAVLLVIACHAAVPGLAGGYIGVDVFFVISGFLITRLLRAEWQREGNIDVLDFYTRRIRRLLPAFVLVVAFVLAAIWTIYAPLEQPRLLSSVFAASLYFSNVHYALEATNYLAPAAKLDPMLHTWSLGVEEQFYLAWPLLLLAMGALAQRNRGRLSIPALVLGGVLAASLLACVHLTLTRQPLAFFLPFTRAWEFAAGALVAVFAERWLAPAGMLARLLSRPWTAASIALAGMGLVLASAVLLDATASFPGWRAAGPVAGTVLLILVIPVSPANTLARRLLTLPLMQWLGRLSYGWYLWHWPLLVLGREILPRHGLVTDLVLVGLALGLAQLSYTLIEHPLREGALLRRRVPAFAMALVVAITGTVTVERLSGAAVDLADSPRFQRLMAAQMDIPALYQYDCDRWFHDAALVECVSGMPGGRQTMVLIGDSHAGQWYSALDAIARDRGWRLVVMTKSACPIVDKDFFYPRLGRVFHECAQWRQAAVERIQRLRPALVIVANSENYEFADADWAPGIARALTPLAEASSHLVVLRDTPNPGFSAPSCLARKEWNPTLSWRECSFDPNRSLSPVVLAAYRSLARDRPDISLIDMTPTICPESPCPVLEAGVIKYRDFNHLSDSFVKALALPLAGALLEVGALSP